MLLAAVRAIESIILASWPRMTADVYRLELVKALSLCWTTLGEEHAATFEQSGTQLKNLQHELKIAGKLLAKAVEGELDFGEEIRPLTQLDPSLKDVFM